MDELSYGPSFLFYEYLTEVLSYSLKNKEFMLYFDKYQGILMLFRGVTDSTGIVELELRFVGWLR